MINRYVALLSILLFVSIQMIYGQDACVFVTDPIEIGTKCSNAPYLCHALLNGYSGSLSDKNDSTDQPDPLCNGDGTPENVQWFTFIPCKDYVYIVITPSNCVNEDYPSTLGIQAGIYTDCDFQETVACASDFTESAITLEAFVIPGQTYYIYIDGYTGSVCDYDIEVKKGLDENPLQFSTSGNITIEGIDELCTDGISPHQYQLVGDCELTAGPACTNQEYISGIKENWFCYQWKITPSTGWIINGDHNDKTIDIVWENPGNYNVSCEIVLHPSLGMDGDGCLVGSPCEIQSMTVEVTEPTPIHLPTVFLCEGDSIEFCGEYIKTAGGYQCSIPNSCDYEVLIVEIKEESIQDLGNIYLCPGECFTLNDLDYCALGSYSVEEGNCNTIFLFNLVEVDWDVDVSGIIELDCNVDKFTVESVVNTSTISPVKHKWYFENQLIGTSDQIEIDAKGQYKLLVYVDDYESSCFEVYDFEIIENLEEPSFSLNAAELDCDTEEVTINFSSNDAIESVYWTGKNNFSSSLLNPTVSDSGLYEVLVTGENGCTQRSEYYVTANYPKANIEVDFHNLNCDVVHTQLGFSTSLTIDSLVWIGPEAKKYFEMHPTITVPGEYTLTLYAKNGCDYTHLFEILGDFKSPVVVEDTPEKWGCKTENIPLNINVNDVPDFTVSWSTDAGEIISDNSKKSIKVGGLGIYNYVLINDENGCSSNGSIEILPEGNIPQEIISNKSDLRCYGLNDGSIIVNEVVGGEAPFQYYLNGNNVNEEIYNLSSGEYILQIIDKNGCEISQKYTIQSPIEMKAEMDGPSFADYFEFVNYNSVMDFTLYNIDVINWYDTNNNFLGSGEDISFQIYDDEVITMEIIDDQGCVITREMEILINRDFNFYKPTVFSPNRDGINDLFYLSSQQLPNDTYTMYIFDRWGNKLYDEENLIFNDSNKGWDGTYSDSKVLPGTYTYLATTELFGETITINGSVTIIK